MARWGFNTLGAWSEETLARAGPSPLALTPVLDLGMSFTRKHDARLKAEQQQNFPDVFDPEFDIHVRRRANELCSQWRDERSVIGWFIDNELTWGPDWRGPAELLRVPLQAPAPRSAGYANDMLISGDSMSAGVRQSNPGTHSRR